MHPSLKKTYAEDSKIFTLNRLHTVLIRSEGRRKAARAGWARDKIDELLDGASDRVWDAWNSMTFQGD